MANILLVDDESSIRALIKQIIDTSVHEVEEASNGVEAFNKLQEFHPDVIITDIVMPNQNGIDFIMKVREHKHTTPIIAISGGGGIESNYDYLEISKLIGAQYILRKPFTPLDLRTMLDKALNK